MKRATFTPEDRIEILRSDHWIPATYKHACGAGWHEVRDQFGETVHVRTSALRAAPPIPPAKGDGGVLQALVERRRERELESQE